MTGRTIIAPSILSADAGSFCAEISAIEKAGAEWLHIDVMDGIFVPPITFGDNIVRVARASCKLLLDVHLMVEKPHEKIPAFKLAGSERLTVHVEACSDPAGTLKAITASGMRAGITMKPATPVERVFDLLPLCDLVLVMTVEPGWAGQKFMTQGLQKISALRSEITRRGLSTLIEVDGGINDVTGRQCVEAGADVLVAGSYIFSAPDREAAIAGLRSGSVVKV